MVTLGRVVAVAMVHGPRVEVTGDTAVVLDAGAGNRVTVETPEHESVPVDTWSLNYRRFAAAGGSLNHRYTMPVSAFPDGMYAVPTGPVALGRLEFASRTRLGDPVEPSPFLYDLAHFEPDGIPADLHYLARTDQLAAVVNRFHSDRPGPGGGEIRHFWTPGLAISSASVVPLALPSERVEYLVPGDTTGFRLYRDGELVTDLRPPATGVVVDPDPATYRVEFDVARDAPWWTTSVRTRTAWTFDYVQAPPATTVVLPLTLFDYRIGLDLSNTAPAPDGGTGPPAIEVIARHQAGAEQTPIAGARLWTSHDDGLTWQRRPGWTSGRALPVPARPP